jgi:hypothetical protein
VTEQTPDDVPCRHCGEPIFWDEICWVHQNGWATCGTTMRGGTPVGASVVLDPEIVEDPSYKGKNAEPIGKWS